MSAAVSPTPEANLSAAEQQEKSYQAYVDALGRRDIIRGSVLFPPEFDFSKACPCVQCRSKAAEIKEFDIEIQFKKQLVMKHCAQFENKEDLCLKFPLAAWWTNRMLEIFHKKLKALSKKSGVELTHEKSSSADYLRKMYLDIRQVLVKHDRVDAEPESETKFIDDDDADDKQYDIFDEIDTGRYYYGRTKVKDTAYGVLKEIEDIEICHDKKKEYAEAQKEMLDPSFSKDCIEKQVELVKKLPVQQLKFELEEMISEIHPFVVHIERNEKTLNFISETCCVMIKKMREFWKESPKGNGHISDGWEQIFDSLINEVKSFEEKWKNEYAPIYTPYDRSDTKRQAT